MEQAHTATLHGNVQVATQYLRQNYWIIGLRSKLKQIIHQCVRCALYRAESRKQLMADLPSDRVRISKPFSHCAVDYAGPIKLKVWTDARGIPILRKAWIAVFKCMWTKATHLELVTDCTTSAFLAALDRLIARRGVIVQMRSDNATTFVGADNELRDALQIWSSSEVQSEAVKRHIVWLYNAPYAPHQGGLWEATVKSLKYHLRRVISESVLTYEQYYTVLARIEAVLNARPLAALTDEPTDEIALTPAHFLTGGPSVLPAAPPVSELPDNRLDTWERLQKIHQKFCEAWQSEYLHAMQLRYKWQHRERNLQPGDMVAIIEDQLPPGQWLVGVIDAVHPGKDGLVRNVEVRTIKATYTRAVQKCCYLPIERSYNRELQHQSETE